MKTSPFLVKASFLAVCLAAPLGARANIKCDSDSAIRTKCNSKADCDSHCLSINAHYVGTYGGGSDGRQCSCHTGALTTSGSGGTKPAAGSAAGVPAAAASGKADAAPAGGSNPGAAGKAFNINDCLKEHTYKYCSAALEEAKKKAGLK